MESKVSKKVTVTLVLSEEEAAWLHALVQNPLVDGESEQDTEMRKKFFYATKVDDTELQAVLSN